MIINEIKGQPGNSTPVLYIFCDDKGQTAEYLAGSLLKQLVQCDAPYASNICEELYKKHTKEETQLSLTEIFSSLQKVLKSVKGCYIILDAFDENKSQAKKIITEILNKLVQCHLLITSRYQRTIEISTAHDYSMRAENVDVERYLEEQLSQNRITRNQELRQRIIKEILNKVDGV